MAKPLYQGFSSAQFERTKSFKLVDVDIVKEDLRLHIFTRAFSRVGMGDFGTTILDQTMEPMDQTTLNSIEADVNAVIAYDPRVELLGDIVMVPLPDEHALVISATLRFIQLNLIDALDIRLDFDL